MTTLFMTHPSSLEHDTGPGHPESVARLETVLRVLDGPADLDEEFETLVGGEPVPVAVVGDRHPVDQFHHEIRPA